MTIQTHISTSAPQFGHSLQTPVDDVGAWPDLRHRDLTVDELAALRFKIARMVEVVENFDRQLEHEESARRDDPAWSGRTDRPPYVPGTIVSYIHISQRFAQGMLDERRGDEVAVAHLRLAEGLARQLVNWRGNAGEGLIDALFTDVRSPEPGAPRRGAVGGCLQAAPLFRLGAGRARRLNKETRFLVPKCEHGTFRTWRGSAFRLTSGTTPMPLPFSLKDIQTKAGTRR